MVQMLAAGNICPRTCPSYPRELLADVDDAGRTLAQLLVRCRDQSLVVNTARGTQLRGDEATSADVYPPHRHPRINVKG